MRLSNQIANRKFHRDQFQDGSTKNIHDEQNPNNVKVDRT